MISVIVPTLWVYPPFLDFVSYYVRLDVVGEVIIINNEPIKTPNHAVLAHPKVRVITLGRNIFVNPAWNLGVREAKFDYVAILNDDLIFDIRLFYKVADFIRPDMGAFGLSKGDVNFGQMPITTGEINFYPFTGTENGWGFGELMFVPKKYWIDIPDGLDVGFGDVWIFERYCFNGFTNYFIGNCWHYHESSLSVRHLDPAMRKARLEREKAIYQYYRQNVILNANNGMKKPL